MNNKRVFAFDFDGVIADSAQAYVDAINSVSMGLGATRVMTVEMLSSMPDYKHQYSAEMTGIPAKHVPKYSHGLREYFHQQPNPLLVEAIGPILQQLSHLGSVVVLSANEHSVISTALLKLSVHVDNVYAHHGREQKTAVLQQLATNARVLMVGDTLSDCQAAQAAEVDMLAVSWGWQGREMLAAEGVPVVDDTEQLLHWALHWGGA